MRPTGRRRASCHAAEDAGIDRALNQRGFPRRALRGRRRRGRSAPTRGAAFRRHRRTSCGYVRRVLLQRPRRPGAQATGGETRREAVPQRRQVRRSRSRVGREQGARSPGHGRAIHPGRTGHTDFRWVGREGTTERVVGALLAERRRSPVRSSVLRRARVQFQERVHREGGRRRCGVRGGRRVVQ